MGAIEVWNSKERAWDDLPFINEDGSWRLAVGDIFSGGYKKPGKGRDEIEKEAANVMSPAAPSNAAGKMPTANAPATGPATK